MVERYLKESHGSTHSFGMSIKNIFAVEREGEAENFRADLGNRYTRVGLRDLSDVFCGTDRALPIGMAFCHAVFGSLRQRRRLLATCSAKVSTSPMCPASALHLFRQICTVASSNF